MELVRSNTPVEPAGGPSRTTDVVNAVIAGVISAVVYEAFRRDNPIVVNPSVSLEIVDGQDPV